MSWIGLWGLRFTSSDLDVLWGLSDVVSLKSQQVWACRLGFLTSAATSVTYTNAKD